MSFSLYYSLATCLNKLGITEYSASNDFDNGSKSPYWTLYTFTHGKKKKKPSQSFVSFYEQEKNVFYIPQMIGIESCFLISGL